MSSPVESGAVEQGWWRLDAPTKAALRWAAATALDRNGGTAHDVDSLDLLAGILLADLRGNPARELLEHFAIPPGAVVRRAGVRPPSAEALLAAIKLIPEGLPPLGDTELVLDRILSSTPAEPDGLVSLRELFGALLEQRALPATQAIGDSLTARAVEPNQVFESYREYLVGRASYAEFLRDRFPYRRPHVELPAYLADQPRPRGAASAEVPDLVGIGAEVDGFAYLIASTQLVPPLAVGLFGEWGSGKSYFLRSAQRRIDAVAAEMAVARREQPGIEPPFHSRIVQIEFNAWQYVEGDLWASLLEHLFRNLRITGPDSDDLVGTEQQYWIEQIRHADAAQQDALCTRDRLEGQHREAEAEVRLRRLERDHAVAELERQRAKHPLRGWRPPEALVDQVRRAAALAGIDTVATQVEGLTTELRQAQQAMDGAATVLAPLRAGGWRYLLAVVLLLLLPPVVAFGVERLDFSAVSTIATWVTSLLAALAGYLRFATRFVQKATRAIADAQDQLNAEEHRQRAQFDRHVQAAEDELRTVQEALTEAVAEEQRRAAEVAEAQAELAKTTPQKVLTEFITDRLGSEDYRGRLGVPALVRRDLDRLSRLVAARHDPSSGPREPGEYLIDRIVLYIDDLDRCPTDHVIKVLEAVHLLLAFPLFVVVVAVDARWLASSLHEHYAQLRGRDATPEDYLEKIFQVPFVVRPLAAETRLRMLRGLLTPSLADPAVASTDEADGAEVDGAENLDPADLPEFREVVASFSVTDHREPLWLAATNLTINTDELRTLENAADLIATTPRSVKRYVNLYLLARSIGISQGWTLPPDGQLAILLAIATGLPRLADTLLPALARDSRASQPLGEALNALSDNTQEPPDQMDTLNTWIHAQPDRAQLNMSGLTNWITLISRFCFSGRTPH